MKQIDHLSNYFMLPLIGYNKFSFGEGNFINSYVTTEREVVVILRNRPALAYHLSPTFKADFDIEGKFAIAFTIPEEYEEDFTKFLDGKYSQMSPEAKEIIKYSSGLRYNIPDPARPGNVICDDKLLALDRHPQLRANLERSLNCVIPDDVELLSKPSVNELLIKDEIPSDLQTS